MAVAPPPSITTSQSLSWESLTDPIETIFPSCMIIESPVARGSRQSPVMIVSRFVIAVFNGTSYLESGKSVLLFRRGELEPAYARIQSPTVGQADDHGNLVGLRRIGQHDRYAVIVRADVKGIL